MIDILLKLPPTALTGNRRLNAGLTTALKARGIGDFLFTRDVDGEDSVMMASHEMAVRIIKDLGITPAILNEDGDVITPAITAGPHLMIRMVDGSDAHGAWLASRDVLPVGVSERLNPGTVGWFGG